MFGCWLLCFNICCLLLGLWIGGGLLFVCSFVYFWLLVCLGCCWLFTICGVFFVCLFVFACLLASLVLVLGVVVSFIYIIYNILFFCVFGEFGCFGSVCLVVFCLFYLFGLFGLALFVGRLLAASMYNVVPNTVDISFIYS